MRLSAGELDRRVVVLQSTVTTLGSGHEKREWAEGETLYAKITYGSGAERRVATQEQSTLVATVIVRKSNYTAALGPLDYALRFDGGDWDIEHIAPMGRNVAYSITAKRRLS